MPATLNGIDSNLEGGEWRIDEISGVDDRQFTFWKGPIDGILVIETEVSLADTRRGYFKETYREDIFGPHGVPRLIQANQSMSLPGVLRGLHMQHPNGQGKLVRVTAGAVLDVAVDVRPSSPTYKKWVSFVVSSENHRLVYVPPAFLHGFYVLGKEPADFNYGVTDYYNADSEKSVAWNDEDLNIRWGVTNPTLAPGDANAKPLSAQTGMPTG